MTTRNDKTDTRVTNILNVLISLRYAMMRSGMTRDEIEDALSMLVCASGDERWMKKKEEKVMRMNEAVNRHRFGKKADGWVCPDSPKKLEREK